MGLIFLEPLIPIIGILNVLDSDFSGMIRFPNKTTRAVVAILIGVFFIFYAIFKKKKMSVKEITFNQQPQLFEFSEQQKKILRTIYLISILLLGGINLWKGIFLIFETSVGLSD